MKNRFITILTLLMLFALSSVLLAQEIVDVPDEYQGSYFGVLNRFIMDDTTSTGERAHPNAQYRLKRGHFYDVNSMIRADFSFSLIADDEDPANPSRPPIVYVGKDAQGGWISPLFYFSGEGLDIKFKNVIFQGVHADEVLGDGTTLMVMEGAFHRFETDRCVYTGWSVNIIWARSSDRSVWIATNNVFRNNFELQGVSGGTYYSNTTKTAHNDTIIFRNNTFFNNGGNNFLAWEFLDYFEFTHNTMYNLTINALWIPYLTNAKVNDNIFYDYQTVGETEWELVNGHWDKGSPKHGRASVCKLNLVDPQTLIDNRMTEADRHVEYKNNVYFWSQTLRDYWANGTSQKDIDQGYTGKIYPTLWINAITDSMFKDDANYPYLVEENNINVDPGFDATMGAAVLAKEIPFITEYRRLGWTFLENATERYYNPAGAGKLFDLPWPLPESLAYTNETVMTHAEGGKPAGDLNWWPLVGVKKIDRNIPSEYKLSQNYPNPFNPSTEINFSIPVSGNTTLAIYNVLGQEVATLVNEELSAGSYNYQFDASNLTSGIYFYKLQSNDYSQVKKMMLLK